jgi:multidrug efflux pump subunit AcrA (membrane-fusion protein)
VNVPAQAEIVLSATVDAITIPERCVRTDPSGRSTVMLRSSASERIRVVEVGVIQKDRIQIRSGLEPGQTVVCRTLP